MQKISIRSGFRRGGSLMKWDGNKFQVIARAGENTYHGDGDSSFSWNAPEGFKGAVVRFWGVSSMSTNNSCELLGFSEDELGAPSPVRGWAVEHGPGAHAVQAVPLTDRGAWLAALARGQRLITTEELVGRVHQRTGDRLVELPYQWGDRAAAHFVVLSEEGEVLLEDKGVGDMTPIPVHDACWRFTCLYQEQEAARRRAQELAADEFEELCFAAELRFR